MLQQFPALDTLTFYYMLLIHPPRKRPHFYSRAYKTLSSSISDALHLDESSTIQPEPLTKPAKLQVTGLA
ncbi:hypothetical protein NXS19_000881 [Fusarium pseudograminearum]|nr:hypothetical protein NXS19_000881 [Fusarium pseudograminearum]